MRPSCLGVVNRLAARLGFAAFPRVGLVLGFAGAAAVVSFSALLAQARLLPALRCLGGRSIVVYLAFFLPMAVTRIALLKLGVIDDAGAVALIVTASAVLVPLAVERLVQGTRFVFLFERPVTFRLPRAPRGSRLVATEKAPKGAATIGRSGAIGFARSSARAPIALRRYDTMASR